MEVLERELQGMGGGVQVKHNGGVNDDEIVELGEVVVDERMKSGGLTQGVRERKKRGGGGWGWGGGGG